MQQATANLRRPAKTVQKEGKFRVSLYKALLFLHVQSGIKSGALNLEDSYFPTAPFRDKTCDSF